MNAININSNELLYTPGRKLLLFPFLSLITFASIIFIFQKNQNSSNNQYSITTNKTESPVKNYTYTASIDKNFSQAEAIRGVANNNPIFTRSHFIQLFTKNSVLNNTTKEYPHIIIRYFRNLFLFFISINAP